MSHGHGHKPAAAGGHSRQPSVVGHGAAGHSRLASSHTDTNFTFKVVLLGDSAVGKTSMLRKATDGALAPLATMPTLGVDMGVKKLKLEGGASLTLQCWDTAGQEKFHSITRAFIRDVQGVILMYDVTREASFKNVRNWLKDVSKGAPDCVVVLVGNKCDVTAGRQVPTSAGVAMAKALAIPFYETSAKTSENVEATFSALGRALWSVAMKELGGAGAGATVGAATLPAVAHALPAHDTKSWKDRVDTVDLAAISTTPAEDGDGGGGRRGGCAC